MGKHETRLWMSLGAVSRVVGGRCCELELARLMLTTIPRLLAEPLLRTRRLWVSGWVVLFFAGLCCVLWTREDSILTLDWRS